MKADGIDRICVVGAGNMGHQIALCAALAGYEVRCTDALPEALKRAEDFADTYLSSRVASGKISNEAAKQARENISFVTSLREAASNADFVIEAIVEKLEAKRELFSKLDTICTAHAILATNSSYIVSSRIADSTGRPGKVLNMHFFNPALVMKLVEVVQGPHVTAQTVSTAMEVSKSLGKVPVLVKKEIYGFLVNRIWTAIRDEALYLHDMGIASYEDIDLAVVNALGHPMGPFRLMDMIGIDLEYQVALSRYQETGNSADKPSPLLVEKYARGEWGNKTGKGFYDHTNKR